MRKNKNRSYKYLQETFLRGYAAGVRAKAKRQSGGFESVKVIGDLHRRKSVDMCAARAIEGRTYASDQKRWKGELA